MDSKKIKDNSILLFMGDVEVCYGILRYFSDELKRALVSMGEEVFYFNPQKDDIRECFGIEFKAVIGFMEHFFYNTLPGSNTLLFDLIGGPKFNYWLDHPAFYYQFQDHFPKNYHVLTLDRNYVNYINEFFDNVKAYFLPPGARDESDFIPFSEREYNLTFMGTYVDYRNVLNSFNANDETTRIISTTYLDYLIQYPQLTAEEAFEQTLQYLGADTNKEQFITELGKVHRIATMGAARYYKEKVVQTIVENGITVDVFSDSWKNAPFNGSAYLRINPEVPSDRVVDIYKNSKMSLNIMTWHKDSITERVLDSMIAGSITLTDDTPALREAFTDGRDLLFFSLDNLKIIPNLIMENMNSESIALAGHQAVAKGHLWKDRARDLLCLIDDIRKEQA